MLWLEVDLNKEMSFEFNGSHFWLPILMSSWQFLCGWIQTIGDFFDGDTSSFYLLSLWYYCYPLLLNLTIVSWCLYYCYPFLLNVTIVSWCFLGKRGNCTQRNSHPCSRTTVKKSLLLYYKEKVGILLRIFSSSSEIRLFK